MKHIKYGNTELSRKGDFAEYYAVTWLWDNGYEVFQNCGCTGPIDLVATDKKGNTLLIDVKTEVQAKPSCPNSAYVVKHVRTKLQKKLGVVLLGFNPVTRTLRFIQHGIAGGAAVAEHKKLKMKNSK